MTSLLPALLETTHQAWETSSVVSDQSLHYPDAGGRDRTHMVKARHCARHLRSTQQQRVVEETKNDSVIDIALELLRYVTLSENIFKLRSKSKISLDILALAKRVLKHLGTQIHG